MKKIITIVLLFISSSSFASIHLTCTMNNISEPRNGTNESVILFSMVRLNCVEIKNSNNHYTIYMDGIGPGLKYTAVAKYKVHCPSVSKKRLKKFGKVSFADINISAGFIFGADVGVMLNHRGGSCAMIGGEFGSFGASATIGKFTIAEGETDFNNNFLFY